MPDEVFSPARAYWNQRLELAQLRPRILALSGAVGRPSDMWPYQFTQLLAAALEFQPDLILELGRGHGNSTCAFTEAAGRIPGGCRVVSVCRSSDFRTVTAPRLCKMLPETWFAPLEAREGDILKFDFRSALAGSARTLLFWDAHGFQVAECVLGAILPELASHRHLVVMHDLSDTRYGSPESLEYGESGLWKGGNDAIGSRVKLGIIDSAVEQSVAILDFATRNRITLNSADHSFHSELDSDQGIELANVLGEHLFSLKGHWFYFTLNEHPGPYTFPKFRRR